MYTFSLIFLLFFIYSVFGWIIESISCSIYYKKIVDRGFLIGPYCPIYGIAALFMILALTKYKEDSLVLFIMAILITSIVEYITSYIMEKVFRTRWWDYSYRTFNVNGRVCLINSLCFGVLGVLLLKIINPFITSSLMMISPKVIYIIALTCAIIFATDTIVSIMITFNLKKTADMLKKDCSEQITSKTKDILAKKSKLFQRINIAFPNYNILPKKFKTSKR